MIIKRDFAGRKYSYFSKRVKIHAKVDSDLYDFENTQM